MVRVERAKPRDREAFRIERDGVLLAESRQPLLLLEVA